MVVPVFNEEDLIDKFYDRSSRVLRSLETERYEMIFVDDGSIDTSFERLKAIARKRRFGQDSEAVQKFRSSESDYGWY